MANAIEEKPQQKLYTLADVVRILQVDERTIRRHVRAGRLPEPLRIGQLLRWHAGRFDSWIDGGMGDVAV